MKVQLTLIQLDNYGPWTTTLGSDREHKLQVLQAEIYAAIQRNFSNLGGLVFYNRFDELMAVSNGISKDDHRRIMNALAKKFPVTVSMSIGVGDYPLNAQRSATESLRKAGGPQSSRKGVLTGDEPIELESGAVQISHMDVNGVSHKLMDKLSAYETSMSLLRVHSILAQELWAKKTLTFYLGGDNFMSISNGVTQEEYKTIISRIWKDLGIDLKCGVGIARVGRRAAEIATKSLDKIREMDRRIDVLVGSDL